MGWLITAAYAATVIACWRAARLADTPQGRAGGVRRQWMLMTALMGLLCLNKQLDLQSLLTQIGRVTAQNQGWYSERRDVQKAVVLGTLGVSLSSAAFVLFRFRHFWIRNALLFAGLALLCTFIAVRAISFHHVDTQLRTHFIGDALNRVLELSGIALVWLAAARARPGRARLMRD